MAVISQANLLLVHGVDQLLDYYEINKRFKPDKITITKNTYDALLAFVNDGKREPSERITHYCGVKLVVIK